MSYESWRISYQSSEQAARAAFNYTDQLRQRVAELEAENARLKQVNRVSIPTNTMEQWAAGEIRMATNRLREQLAASQLESKRLREALNTCANPLLERREVISFANEIVSNSPNDSTLREYVAGKMKPLVEALGDVSELLAGTVTSTDIRESQRIIVTALEVARKEIGCTE